jgi:hypothetical protein
MTVAPRNRPRRDVHVAAAISPEPDFSIVDMSFPLPFARGPQAHRAPERSGGRAANSLSGVKYRWIILSGRRD